MHTSFKVIGFCRFDLFTLSYQTWSILYCKSIKILVHVYLFIYLCSSIGIVAAQPQDFATSFLGLLIVNYLGSLLFLLLVKVKDYVLLL